MVFKVQACTNRCQMLNGENNCSGLKIRENSLGFSFIACHLINGQTSVVEYSSRVGGPVERRKSLQYGAEIHELPAC